MHWHRRRHRTWRGPRRRWSVVQAPPAAPGPGWSDHAGWGTGTQGTRCCRSYSRWCRPPWTRARPCGTARGGSPCTVPGSGSCSAKQNGRKRAHGKAVSRCGAQEGSRGRRDTHRAMMGCQCHPARRLGEGAARGACQLLEKAQRNVRHYWHGEAQQKCDSGTPPPPHQFHAAAQKTWLLQPGKEPRAIGLLGRRQQGTDTYSQ